MAGRPSTLRELLHDQVPRLYGMAYLVAGERGEAERFVHELVTWANERGESLLKAANPEFALVSALAKNLEDQLGRKAEQSFDTLDRILHSDITRPIDLTRRGIDDPTKVHLMLWELKRTCLTAVLGCLPPGVRISFVLTDVYGYGPAEAAELLDIKESAYRVRLTRARKRVEDYLAPRCMHVDRANPCSCSGRLMIAMDAGFVSEPPAPNDVPHDPFDAEGPRRDVGGLYRGLPKVQLSEATIRRLVTGG